MSIDQLSSLIFAGRPRYGVELTMQDDVEQILLNSRVQYVREYRIGTGAIDFVADGVGIECKVDGSPATVLRQCRRYVESPDLTSLLLVTSRPNHRWPVTELGGKPFRVLWIAGNL